MYNLYNYLPSFNFYHLSSFNFNRITIPELNSFNFTNIQNSIEYKKALYDLSLYSFNLPSHQNYLSPFYVKLLILFENLNNFVLKLKQNYEYLQLIVFSFCFFTGSYPLHKFTQNIINKTSSHPPVTSAPRYRPILPKPSSSTDRSGASSNGIGSGSSGGVGGSGGDDGDGDKRKRVFFVFSDKISFSELPEKAKKIIASIERWITTRSPTIALWSRADQINFMRNFEIGLRELTHVHGLSQFRDLLWEVQSNNEHYSYGIIDSTTPRALYIEQALERWIMIAPILALRDEEAPKFIEPKNEKKL